KYVFIKNTSKEDPSHAYVFGLESIDYIIIPIDKKPHSKLERFLFKININKNSISGVESIYISAFYDLRNNFFLNQYDRNLFCMKDKPGDKFKVTPNWSNGNICISDD